MDTLTFKNESSSIPRLAIYKKAYSSPSLGLIAWNIVAPSKGGTCVVEVPPEFQVYISTGSESDPFGGCRSKAITLATFSARISVQPQPTDDNTGYVPDIAQLSDGVVENQIHVQNSYGRGVWGHILKGGDDIYPPQIISPGDVLMADVRPTYFVAHISEFVRKGSRLVEGELSFTATEMLVGQTLTVTGSRMGGFSFTVT